MRKLVNDQDSNWSEKQNEVLSTPFPMIFGSPSVVDGYCSLELGERDIALDTLRQHRTECALWYRAIKLLVDPLLGEWTFPKGEEDKSNLVLRANLICLEVSSAKAALDLLLAGYYSLTFAGVRHMMESVAQVIYIMQFPSKAFLWEPENKPPSMRVMINEIKKALVQKGYEREEVERFESMYESWALMSKGVHPSGAGLMQVAATAEDPRNIIGAVYRQNLALVAFDHGLFALYMLLFTVPTLGRANDTWMIRFGFWAEERQLWRTDIRGRGDLRHLWQEEEEEITNAVEDNDTDSE